MYLEQYALISVKCKISLGSICKYFNGCYDNNNSEFNILIINFENIKSNIFCLKYNCILNLVKMHVKQWRSMLIILLIQSW